MYRKSVLAAVVLLAPPGVMAQQDAAINTERPSYSSSPYTLAPDRWQVELGYQFADEGGNADVTAHTLPLMLVRVGLADRLEVQLNWAGYNEVNSRDGDVDGRSDALLGAKWRLTDSNAKTPIALFAGVSLPIGSSEFTSDDTDPTLAVFWSHPGIADWFGTIDATFGSQSDMVHNAIGISKSISDRVGTFVEYLATFPEGEGAQHSLHGGITFLKSNDMQLDLNIGAGLNSRATNFVFGFGIAQRF